MVVSCLNQFFQSFVESLQLLYFSIFFDQIWGLDINLLPLPTLQVLT